MLTVEGVINFVSIAKLLSNVICQNPEFASSFKCNFESSNLSRMFSTILKIIFSLCKKLFKAEGSMDIPMQPLGSGISTI